MGERARRWRRGPVMAAVLAAVAALAVVLGMWRTEDGGPSALCEIAPADGEAAITAALGSCPNGSTIRFPPNMEYHQANRIMVTDRRDLVIDGNGSTFTTNAGKRTENPPSGPNGNWMILRGSNVTLRNLTAVGAFDVEPPRDLSRASAHPDVVESNPAFGIYGSDGVRLVDVTARNIWGDGVTLGPDIYVDPAVRTSDASFPRNVTVTRMTVEKAFRHCWGLAAGINVVIEDSTCRDAWYAGIDAEVDTVDQPLVSHRYLRNTFEGFLHFGILVPVAGDNTRDFEIRGNRFLTGADSVCQGTILLGAYPDSNPRVFTGVVVDDNEILAPALAISFDHVEGGSIRGNRIQPQERFPGDSPVAACGHDDRIRVTHSSDVEVDANKVG